MQKGKKVSFPVKYLEENLVFNQSGAVWAYYEWKPYSYCFISEDKALSYFRDMKRLIAGSKGTEFHMLEIAVEENIHDTVKRSKKSIKGALAETANAYMDRIEEHLQKLHGSYEVGYRFYIGFRLSEEDYGLKKKSIGEELVSGVKEFFQSVNETVFGDYTKVPNREVERNLRMEKLLYSRISRQFPVRRAKPRDIAYIIKHINGEMLDNYEGYSYQPEVILEEDVTKIKTYDLVRLSSCVLENKTRYLNVVTQDTEKKVSYLAFSEMTQENYFPYSSEVLYYQQEQFDYPVDTSLKVEVLKNRDALKNTRDKKADLSDLDENAWEAGSEVNRNVLVSKQEAEDLEAELEREKEDMYKVSCLVRVEAESEDELLKRVAEVKEFYRSYNMILECPLTDQMGFHEEFFPSTERYVSDYLQYVKGDFLAGLGFGATHMLGDGDGIYLGYDVLSYRSVYVKPWLAAQGVEGSITNALAKAFTGSLGGGKTMAMSLLSLHSCLFGAKGLIIDPKGDRKNWKRDLPMFGEHLNLIHITNAEENRGLFDPFVVMESDEDKKDLALSVLMFLCGYTTRDAGFALLTEHIDKVLAYPEGQPKGMLWIVEELYRTDTKESREMAAHIQAFANLGVTKLIFGDGQTQKNLTMDAVLNVILVENLTLPTMGTAVKEYRLEEILSVAVLLVISMYSLKFIHMQRDVFKFVDLDEAWSWLQVPEAKALSDKLVRAGRSMNAAINFATQNCDDLTDEKMKNNIGMKFAFRSTDREEIRKTLLFLGLEDTEGNAEVLRSLKNGECLMQDISGHIGIVYIDYVFQVFFRALDTRPPQEEEGEEPEYVAVEAQGKGAGL